MACLQVVLVLHVQEPSLTPGTSLSSGDKGGLPSSARALPPAGGGAGLSFLQQERFAFFHWREILRLIFSVAPFLSPSLK